MEIEVPGSAESWLRHARSDLQLARTGPAHGVLLEALCFHAQQAAEKAIKAILIALAVPFPRTHNIRTLLDVLPAHIATTPQVEEAAALTDFAVTSRYPGTAEPVSEHEYTEAVDLASAVVEWAVAVTRTQGAARSEGPPETPDA